MTTNKQLIEIFKKEQEINRSLSIPEIMDTLSCSQGTAYSYRNDLEEWKEVINMKLFTKSKEPEQFEKYPEPEDYDKYRKIKISKKLIQHLRSISEKEDQPEFKINRMIKFLILRYYGKE